MNQTHGIVIYTWGYHAERLDTLAALRAERNALIVDTRFHPSSRLPTWRRPVLERRFGTDYVWVQDFGNVNYQGSWTDPVVLKNPAAGLATLEPLIAPGRHSLLLCMCPTPDCHRSDVAAYLAAARGWAIEHLPGRGWSQGDPIGPPAAW